MWFCKYCKQAVSLRIDEICTHFVNTSKKYQALSLNQSRIIGPVQEFPAEVQHEVQPEAVGLHVVVEKPEDLLFKQLAVLRRQIASEVKLPPFFIFHDTTLKEMCKRLPTDLQALKSVQGVGESKLEKYGSRFVEIIREYAGV